MPTIHLSRYSRDPNYTAVSRLASHQITDTSLAIIEAIYRSADQGWTTVEEVKRRTGVAFGECQGRRCVAAIATRLDQAPGERGARITPRPPLVPVPASVLAAFADP